MTAVGEAGGVLGGTIGGGLGGIIGAPILPPIGGIIGRYLGRGIGRVLGKAAAEALANQMDDANDDADDLPDTDAGTACAECGEIDCFNPPKGMDPAEFLEQLKEQQDALRGMDPQDILDNMAEYARNGRPVGDAAARAAARVAHLAAEVPRIAAQLMGQGIDADIAEGMAQDQVFEQMADQDATHVVDLIAGGDGSISGLGNRSANRSIGSQWRHRGPGSDKTRAQQLKEYAEQAKAEGSDMSELELNICPDEGGGAAGSDAPAGQSPSGPGTTSSGPGNVPMS